MMELLVIAADEIERWGYFGIENRAKSLRFRKFKLYYDDLLNIFI